MLVFVQKTFRYLWRFYSLLFRGFSVAFPWLFRGPLLSRKTVFGPFSWLFRGFFVAPVLGKIYAYSPWNSLLICGVAQLSHNMLQNGVSHRRACVKLSTKGWGVSHVLGASYLPPQGLNKDRAVWGIAAGVLQYCPRRNLGVIIQGPFRGRNKPL